MATVERRTVLKGATALGAGAIAVPLLAACGSGSSGGTAAPTDGTTTGSSAGTAKSSGAPAASGVTVDKSKVPVGGGVIKGKVVVTQPTAGDFKAFSSTCTHQGCTVGAVEGGFIVCPCHGSHYAIATGVPTAAGPSTTPLPAKTVTASGNNLIIS